MGTDSRAVEAECRGDVANAVHAVLAFTRRAIDEAPKALAICAGSALELRFLARREAERLADERRELQERNEASRQMQALVDRARHDRDEHEAEMRRQGIETDDAMFARLRKERDAAYNDQCNAQ